MNSRTKPLRCPCGCGERVVLCEAHRRRLAAVRDAMADTPYDRARERKRRIEPDEMLPGENDE